MIENLAQLRGQLIKNNPDLKQPLMSVFDLSVDDPRHMPRLSLEQQKKRAKELLRALKRADTSARTRAYEASLRIRDLSARDRLYGEHKPATLAQCQHIIASELGFRQWRDLKNHIEHATIAQQAVENGEPTALDATKRTLHIRCGTDIKHPLAISGFCGDFLAFTDPYCQGPVIETDTESDFIDARTLFISSAYHLPDIHTLRASLVEEYHSLALAKDYERVNIWLEHDSYDQLILAKLLDYFSEPAYRPCDLQLITVEGFPGIKVFNGIGALPPDAFRILWGEFNGVTDEVLFVGKQTWQALKAPCPTVLLNIALSNTPALPTMAKAVARHLQELPGLHNGLSLVEELTLTILADKGAMNAAKLFGWYTNHYEPLTFLGDLQYWDNITRLTLADTPAITLTKTGEHPKDWQVALTDTGLALLQGAVDWLSKVSVTRWVGGIEINPTENTHWRVDRQSHRLRIQRC